MSKYTTEVRFICENAAGLHNSTGYSGVNDIIERAIPKVFDFDFPIFDESYRNVLCKKILKHYYTREICAETVGLWKLWLDTRMNEIMPYYNQLYKSELLDFNPLYDTDITRTSKRDNTATGEEEFSSNRDKTGNSETNSTNSGSNKSTTNQTTEGTSNGTNEVTLAETSESTSNGTNESTTENTTTATTTANTTREKTERDLYSDTPQGALTNVENEEYLTNARKKIGNETDTESGSSNSSTNSNTSGSDSNTGTGKVNSTTTGADTNSTTGKLDSETNGEASATGHSTTVITDKDKFTSNQNKNINSTEDYLETVSGKQGGASYSKLIMEYRDTFLNIDMQIIDALSDLFFGLW